MQLSNFWRDIGEDWQRGRIYIPKEDLDLFNLSEDVIAAGKPTPEFIELMEYQFDRTQRYYAHARQAVPMLAAGRWAVMSALEIYAAIIPSIRSAGYDIFTNRAGTNTFRKLGLAVKALWQVRLN
jgi:phytoene synthase